MPAGTNSRTVLRVFSRAGVAASVVLCLFGLILSMGPLSGRAGNDTSGSTPAEDAVFCFGLVDFEQGAIPLSLLQAGRVAEVLVRENQSVKAGTVLLRLDDRQGRSRVAAAAAVVQSAEAQLTSARRQPSRLRSLIAQQQADLDAASSRLAGAEKSLARQRRLVADKLHSPDEVGIAEDEVKALAAVQRAAQSKLDELRQQDWEGEVRRAEAELAGARANLEQAQQALDEYTLRAPADGIVLRLSISRGEVFSERTTKPAVLFGPDGPRVIRAEVDQEFARGLRVNQEAVAEDDVRPERVWKGHVQHVSNWYLPRREVMDQLLYARESRTLECLIALKPGQPPLRVGQRMRVTIR